MKYNTLVCSDMRRTSHYRGQSLTSYIEHDLADDVLAPLDTLEGARDIVERKHLGDRHLETRFVDRGVQALKLDALPASAS